MPFEILVNFPRGAVYFAGERLQCFITVRNTSSSMSIAGDSADTHRETEQHTDFDRDPSNTTAMHDNKNILALLGVHLYMQCIFTEQRSQPPKRAPYNTKFTVPNSSSTNNINLESSITSMHAFQCAESSNTSSTIIVVNETERQILACNVNIEINNVRTYVYEVVIPSTMPASFRGHFVKYCCRVAIGVQTIGIPIQVFRTNVWIMPCSAVIRRLLGRQSSSTSPPPPLQLDASSRRKNHYNKDDVMQLVDEMSARRRRPLEFSIRTSDGQRVGSLLLSKTSYKIGEEIAGTFDFADAQVSCAQVVVVLQAHERIAPECMLNADAAPVSKVDLGSDKVFCVSTVQSQFCVPIPLQVTPTFSSDVVQLSYVLQFTFMLSDDKVYYNVPGVDDSTASILWTPPERVDIKPLEWQLPVEIWPCDPEHVASVHSPEMFLGSIVLKLL